MKLFLFLLLISQTVYAEINLDVITDTNHPVNCSKNHVYRLQELNALNFAIEDGNVNSKRLLDASIERIKEASTALNLASEYDIKFIPAFVFENGKYVVYGVSDCNQAINIYKKKRSA